MPVRALSNQKAKRGRRVARHAAVTPRPSSMMDTMAKLGAETRRSWSGTPMTST
jgi:signal recognition particle subunit SEC65